MARIRKMWLQPAEMAALLGISTSAVYARAKAGTLEARQEHDRLVVRRPAEIPTFDGMLSTHEVAAMLATHRNSVGPLVTAGRLPAVRRGVVLYFRPEDIEAYMEARRVVPGTMPWARQYKDPETGRWRFPAPAERARRTGRLR